MIEKEKRENDTLNQPLTGNADAAATGSPVPDGDQLLGKEAEKYLREGGNIEDLPEEEDWQEDDKKQ